MAEVISIENLCRTCLIKEVELNSVFEVFIGAVRLDSVINAVTGIKIECGDGLPSTVCVECREKALSAFNYKRRSQESENSLRNLLNDNKDKPVDKAEYETGDKSKSPALFANECGIKTEQNSRYDHEYVDEDIPASEEYGDCVKNEKPYQDSETINQCQGPFLDLDPNNELQYDVDRKVVKVESNDSSTFCPLCGTCYDNAAKLTKHMWSDHAEFMGPKKRGRPKKMLTSTILNKLSENGFRVKQAVEAFYDCMFCKEQYKTKEDLGVHIVEHKDMKVLCCILCKKMYIQRKYFENHICMEGRPEVKLKEEPPLLSNVLSTTDISEDKNKNKDMDFLTEVLLQEILDPIGDVENLNLLKVCSICSEVFFSEDEILSHNDAEHPELSQRCNCCFKVFASTKSAARHREICKQIERKHTCSSCGLRFAYEISLNKHILRWHEGQSVSVKFIDPKTKRDEKKYQCDVCNKCFCRKDLLAKHTKIHMPGEKQFECEICKKKFHRRHNLRIHKRVHEIQSEKGSSNCLCLYCGRSFSNSSNLIVHMRRHTGEKPYKCDFCGKGFPRSSDLQCHRRSHTGEKPCKCGVCGKAFSRSNKLSRHMRVHTGLKPYKCTYCEKAFSQSNDLTLHIRRHTGDKPYICEICGDRFIQFEECDDRRIWGLEVSTRSDQYFPMPHQLRCLYHMMELQEPKPRRLSSVFFEKSTKSFQNDKKKLL